jgi:hypothetical protein
MQERKPMSPTQLRREIYQVLDDVLETGIPQEVVRGDRTLRIVPGEAPRIRLVDLPRREAAVCTPDELIATSWEGEWEPGS